MYRLFILFFLLGTSYSAWADCHSASFSIFPEKQEIHPNSSLRFEAYGTAQKILLQKQDYAFFLVSEEHTVSLEIICLDEGMFELTQAILKPKESLRSDQTYKIRIDGLTEYEEKAYLQFRNHDLEYEAYSWKICKEADNIPPKWIVQPKFEKSEVQMFGCGPSVNVDFSCQIEESNSKTWVSVELFDLTEGKSHNYVIVPRKENIISIGHGMCAGAFRFTRKHEYKVRFSLMDNCMNSTNQKSAWISFENPWESKKAFGW